MYNGAEKGEICPYCCREVRERATVCECDAVRKLIVPHAKLSKIKMKYVSLLLLSAVGYFFGLSQIGLNIALSMAFIFIVIVIGLFFQRAVDVNRTEAAWFR